MFWNKRLREELQQAKSDLAFALADRDRAWDRRSKLHDDFLKLVQTCEMISRRKPPSNKFKAVHTIEGRHVVEAQDGSLWLRAGDEWLNWSLPDTSVAEATE